MFILFLVLSLHMIIAMKNEENATENAEMTSQANMAASMFIWLKLILQNVKRTGQNTMAH